MNKLIKEAWMNGVSYMITDKLISFYVFFTIILAEMAYVWTFKTEVAMPLTVILLGYMLNVIVLAWLKGKWEGYKEEVLLTALYVFMFIILFTIGCSIDKKTNTIMTVILLSITAAWIEIKEIQSSYNEIKIVSQFLIIGAPFVAFLVCLAMVPIPIMAKIIISLVYFTCIPLIENYEEETATSNIFQLAYDVTWNKEIEEYCNKRFS